MGRAAKFVTVLRETTDFEEAIRLRRAGSLERAEPLYRYRPLFAPLEFWRRSSWALYGNRAVGGILVVIPAQVIHGFKSPGPGRLMQVDIHASDRFITDWINPDHPGKRLTMKTSEPGST